MRPRLRLPSLKFSAQRSLMVAVKFDALEAELAGRQSQMSSLVALIAVQSTPAYPTAIHKSPFINAGDAGNRVTRWIGSERHDEAAAGNHILIRPG